MYPLKVLEHYMGEAVEFEGVLSEKQPTITMSCFGAEFVAMKHGMETLRRSW